MKTLKILPEQFFEIKTIFFLSIQMVTPQSIYQQNKQACF